MRDLAHSQRGSGRVGFIVALAIFLAAVFAGVKIIPVRINAYQLDDTFSVTAVANSTS